MTIVGSDLENRAAPPDLRITPFEDLNLCVVESPYVRSATLYRSDTGRVFPISPELARLVSPPTDEALRGSSASVPDELAGRSAVAKKLLQRLPSEGQNAPHGTKTHSLYSPVPVTRPSTFALTLGHSGDRCAEEVKKLGESVHRNGDLQGVILAAAPRNVAPEPALWCAQIKALRNVVDEVEIETDTDLGLVLRAPAALCPELADAAPEVDHLSAEVTKTDRFVPLRNMGAGWESVSIRLGSASLQETPAMLREWRDEGVKFFELPTPLAAALYPAVREEILPTPDRRAILVHQYSLLFARLLRSKELTVEDLRSNEPTSQDKPRAERCEGGSLCWARRLCTSYPFGDGDCVSQRRLAALMVGDFESLVVRLKRYILGSRTGGQLDRVLDFVDGLVDATSLGWDIR